MNFKEMSLQEYLGVVVRRRRVIIFPVLVAWLIIVPYTLMTPRAYVSRAVVELGTETTRMLQDIGEVKIPRQEGTQAAKERIYSRSYILEVDRREKLRQFLAGEKGKEVSEEELIKFFNDATNIEVTSDLLKIYVEMSDPEKAASVANTIANVYIENTTVAWQLAATKSYDFIQEQTTHYAQLLQETEDKLRKLMQKYPFLASQDIDALETNIQQLKKELIDVEVQLDADRRELTTLLSTGDSEDDAAERLATLQSRLAELETNYSDEWPEIKRIKEEIASIEAKRENNSQSISSVDPAFKRRRIPELQKSIRELVLRKERLRREILANEEVLKKAPEARIEMNKLTRDKEIYEKTYNLLYDRLNNALLAKSADVEKLGSAARLLDPAVPIWQPVKPRRARMVIMATILGFGIGVGIAVLMEYTDRSFRDEQEMSELLGVPVVATLPKVPEIG